MVYTQQSSATTANSNTDEPSNAKKYLRQLSLMLSTRELRLRIFVMWWLFFTASLVFYGLSLSGVAFSSDPFLYMVLGGLMEVPAYTITAPIVEYFGRKWTTAVSYLVCGATILSLTIIPKDMSVMVMTFVMVGKLAISMAYQIIYMYILELLPTEVRLQGLGSAMLLSRLGSITTTFITEILREYIPWMPSAIFGCCSIVAGLATLLLPETNKKHMPDTVGAMEKIGRQEEAEKRGKGNDGIGNEEMGEERISLVTSRVDGLRSEERILLVTSRVDGLRSEEKMELVTSRDKGLQSENI